MGFASSYIYSYDDSDEECVSDEELDHGLSARYSKNRSRRPFEIFCWNKNGCYTRGAICNAPEVDSNYLIISSKRYEVLDLDRMVPFN